MANNEISIVRGTTNIFGIAVKNPNGDPYVISDGQVLVFGLKRRAKDEERVLLKKITSMTEAGVYYLELLPSDTADLETGKYYYDIGLQHGDSVFYNIIPASTFQILPNVTELGDGSE